MGIVMFLLVINVGTKRIAWNNEFDEFDEVESDAMGWDSRVI